MEDVNYYDQDKMLELIRWGEFDFEDSEAMNNWADYGFIKKDVFNDDILKIVELKSCDDINIVFLCENGMTINCPIKRDRRFFDMNGINYDGIPDLVVWLNSDAGRSFFTDTDMYIVMEVDKFNVNGSLMKSYFNIKRQEFIEQTKDATNVYTAKVKSKNHGGFIVDVSGIDAFLPGSLAAANKIMNFDDLLDQDISVMFEDYIYDGDTFIVSNKKFIKHILPEKINNLDNHQLYTGKITGTVKFGIFIEFDAILTGLLHVSEMRFETLDKFKNGEYHAGDTIEFYIKEVAKNNRIILSEYELPTELITIEDFKNDIERSVYPGEVLSIKPIGAFIRFIYKETPFVGLLHIKEYGGRIEPEVGNTIDLYINKVLVEDKKIFLRIPMVRNTFKKFEARNTDD